jgi:cytochrome c556
VALAAQSKNLEDARAGFQNVTAACGACHKAHKKPAT